MDHHETASDPLGRPKPRDHCHRPNGATAPSSPMKLQTSAPSSSFSSLSSSPGDGALGRPQPTMSTTSGSDQDFRSDVEFRFLMSWESSTLKQDIRKQPSLPLKFPPRLQSQLTYGPAPLVAKKRGGRKGGFFGLFSFKRREFDPFAAALKQIREEEQPWYRKSFLISLPKDPKERSATHRPKKLHLLACFGLKA